MMQSQIMPGREWLNDVRRSWLQMMVRLKPGIAKQPARAATDVLVKQILIDQEGPNGRAEEVRDIRQAKIAFETGATGFSRLRANFSEPLMILMSVVGLVLLIACANVANLLLARATARQREISVRLALGATRARLIRQLLAESVLLSACGALLGLLLAQWGSRLLLLLVNRDGVPLALHLDLRVLGFTAAVATLTGILFGLGPALRATRIQINSVLKEGSRGLTSSGAKLSLGKLLVVAQVALSLLLLIGAGLFVRSLANLRHVDVGYERDHILMMTVDATAAGYKGPRATQLWRQIMANVSRVPGVRSATFSENGLFSGSESGFGIEAEGFQAANDRDKGSAFDEVGPGYFETVGISVVKGRALDEKDNEASPKVAWINQASARFYFKSADPIGKHISYELRRGEKVVREVVGVVKDVRDHSLTQEVRRRFYLPAYQPFTDPLGWVNLEIRTRAEPGAMSAAVRAAVQSVDRTLPITDLHPLSMNIDAQMTQERMIAQLSAFFGALALLLAAIGLYGVMSYAMARRTNEIGIRMALGAQPGAVLAMVLRETLVLVGLGLALGLPAALGLTRLVASRLFGLTPYDPATVAIAVVVLVGVAALAGYLPARKAAGLNPVTALRYE
jgi:predicted permease